MGQNLTTNATGIKSIQRGVTTMGSPTVNITISSVNTAKTELRHLGVNVTSTFARIALTNPTTLTVVNNGNGGEISWELTEYY